jgi:uncharacterized protein YceH (UPF0502 family)
MEAAPGPIREASTPPAVELKRPPGWPTRKAAAAWFLSAWSLWLAGAVTGALLVAASIILAMQVTAAGHRVEALEKQAAALSAEVDALRASETAAAARIADAYAQVEELRRRVDALSTRATVPTAAPPQTTPSLPLTPPAPPRGAARR